MDVPWWNDLAIGIDNPLFKNGFVMDSSTCDNQICVHQGWVTLDNWEMKPQQQFVSCLPNQVMLELVEAAE